MPSGLTMLFSCGFDEVSPSVTTEGISILAIVSVTLLIIPFAVARAMEVISECYIVHNKGSLLDVCKASVKILGWL